MVKTLLSRFSPSGFRCRLHPASIINSDHDPRLIVKLFILRSRAKLSSEGIPGRDAKEMPVVSGEPIVCLAPEVGCGIGRHPKVVAIQAPFGWGVKPAALLK